MSSDSTMIVDTTTAPNPGGSLLDEKVNYTASDSIVLDMKNKKAYLYNNAVVEYDDLILKAGYIELDFENDLVFAKGLIDSTGKITQKPISNQGNDEFKAGEITYNFKTKKGKIKDVITQQGEGYIHGTNIKKDSNDVYYVAKGKYTTCDLEHPHFYIGASKIKVIPDDKIITGPAYLNVADVPTPLALPFGYFPNKQGRSSGILIPTYGESQSWGFFLKDGGYYFGNNDFVDLALTGSIYSNTSYALNASSDYKKRYKFNGNMNLGYSKIINGDPAFPTTTSQDDFFVRWRHAQDAKRNPSRRFSANVNAGSSTYNTYNGDVNSDYLSNTFQSNIAYSKKFIGTPLNFAANARHSQNTITKQVDLSLPELSLTMNRVYPFKSKNSVGTNWYDKIGISANANAKNDINTYDSLLFTPQTLEQMNNGVSLNVPITTSVKMLKYFTLNPAVNLSSKGYFQTIEKTYIDTSKSVITDTIQGFKLASDYNLSASLATMLYGNYFFKTKRLKQIRHVMTPSVRASYRPDFSERQYGYYKSVQIDSIGNTQDYSIFQNGVYGSPASGKSGIIGLALNNTLEAKVDTPSDSGAVSKKVKLIDNFNISSSYNVAVDEFNWSPINLSGRTTLFKVLSINSLASLDPYQLDDSTYARINVLEWKNNRLGRLTRSTTSLSLSLHSKKGEKESKTDTEDETAEVNNNTLEFIRSHPDAYIDFDIPWSLYVSYNLNYSKPDTAKTITQTASFSGDLKLTQKWKLSVRSGYDFNTKKLSLTSIDIYRDLHCWELSFSWVPFGLRQSFSLTLNVKSSVLRDLKLSRKRAWQDFQ